MKRNSSIIIEDAFAIRLLSRRLAAIKYNDFPMRVAAFKTIRVQSTYLSLLKHRRVGARVEEQNLRTADSMHNDLWRVRFKLEKMNREGCFESIGNR